MTVAKYLLALAAAALMTACFSNHALARAPMAGGQGQGPGFYRVTLGSFEVTALSDGTIELPVDELLINTTPGEVRNALREHHLRTPLATSVNAYLVNTGDKLVLVDAGAGSLFGPSLGKLSDNLRAAGYTPDQIDEIYITHLHPDHVGGLSMGEQRVFANAVVRAEQQDVDFWLSSGYRDQAPADSKAFFDGAMASLKPYIDAGRLIPFNGDSALVPGVRAKVTHGHTIGHSVYEVESRGQRLVIWGDLIHVAAVQFARPDVAIAFDSDAATAVQQRRVAFSEGARSGDLAGAAHVAFPGLGRLRAKRDGYDWTPIGGSAKSKR